MTAQFPVFFVGAGPGDPELITVRGQRALAQADLIIYTGSLVPETLLKWSTPQAETINSASMTLEAVVDEMVKGWRAGKRIVRLHTGDPSLYGAVFEQMAALKREKIPYQVVPGVTAAFAAAAALGIEYTLPEISQTLIITRMAGRTPVPNTEDLESLARHQASMAVYLSVAMADRVAKALEKGYGRKAPCVVAYRVGQEGERLIRTTVEKLAETVEKENIERQTVILVGEVLRFSPETFPFRSRLYDKDFSHGFRK
ncbi:MAG: precorrin-4 C(11)-methyltransferase [Deltaproteobacteria bacterium]|nr:precorrin-4 C(11)-methyltransferase [Deltaproteobacteria bacterium]MBW2042723.1 precorrin-4 C(11)-methyltransferase [Deltaproteobacteria bacterium]MBW2133221.1 precorrin-4 C(11)-methyltransferase [Deltaproteobacteria bacterium]